MSILNAQADITTQLQAMKERVEIKLTSEEQDLVVRYFTRWGRLKTLKKYGLKSQDLNKILRAAGKL